MTCAENEVEEVDCRWTGWPRHKGGCRTAALHPQADLTGVGQDSSSKIARENRRYSSRTAVMPLPGSGSRWARKLPSCSPGPPYGASPACANTSSNPVRAFPSRTTCYESPRPHLTSPTLQSSPNIPFLIRPPCARLTCACSLH